MNIKEQILEIINNKPSATYFALLKKETNLCSKILEKTSFIENNPSFNERLFCIINDIKAPVKCKLCDNNVSFTSFTQGYKKYCSHKCSKSSPETKELREFTMLEKYGAKTAGESTILWEKRNQTNLNKYGTENPTQSEEIKNKIKQTNLEKYGVENVSSVKSFQEKKEQTFLSKYGSKTSLQNEEIKEKIKKTNLKKYGVENPNQSDDIKKQKKQTNLKKYGVENPNQSDDIKKQKKQTNLKKYGTEYFSQSEEYKKQRYSSFLDDLSSRLNAFGLSPKFKPEEYTGSYIFIDGKRITKEYLLKCNTCEKEFKGFFTDGRIPSSCPFCGKIKGGTSSLESEIEEFLKELNISYVRNKRGIINNYELDFFFPNFNFAIELNGLYYHSYSFLNKNPFNEEDYTKNKLSPNKGLNFHLLKTKLCQEKNIFLFHINENEWIFKKDLVKSMIKYKLNLFSRKINARDCQVSILIDNKEKNSFLENNHIQGKDFSSIKLILKTKEEEIVSMMTFSRNRFSQGETYELVRFSNKQDVLIRGGASKLFNYFVKNILQENETIISFADRRYSDGKIYKILNFQEEYITPPQYKYFKNQNVFNRMFFQKKEIEKLYKQWINKEQKNHLFGLIKAYNPILTEYENMRLNGFDKIYDCGHIKYKFTKI